MYMTKVVISSASEQNALRYREIVEGLGAEVRLVTPATGGSTSTEVLMEGVGGLLLPGGPDVDPALYGAVPDPDAGLEVNRPLDDLDLRVLNYALEQDMPVLAICRGMQLLNVARGGQLIQDLPNHRAVQNGGTWLSETHPGG